MKSSLILSEWLQIFRSELSGYYPDEEIRSIFYLASEHLLNYSKIDIHLKGHESISDQQAEKFRGMLARLKNWEPIQYITGTAAFYGLNFKVDKRVLIPRPETEELTDWIIREENASPAEILDLGTGSGCIAITLANQMDNARVSACDISIDALEVARENAGINNAGVCFFTCDILSPASVLPLKYDILVSNPPYVREMEREFMLNNVLSHEPGIALFVPDTDPLLYYRSIALLGRKYLKDGGKIYLEINENFPHDMVRLLESTGFYGVEIKRDLNGKARMVRGRK